eukprot:6239723-Pyramimonas_sp.AAC.1
MEQTKGGRLLPSGVHRLQGRRADNPTQCRISMGDMAGMGRVGPPPGHVVQLRLEDQGETFDPQRRRSVC